MNAGKISTLRVRKSPLPATPASVAPRINFDGPCSTVWLTERTCSLSVGARAAGFSLGGHPRAAVPTLFQRRKAWAASSTLIVDFRRAFEPTL